MLAEQTGTGIDQARGHLAGARESLRRLLGGAGEAAPAAAQSAVVAEAPTQVLTAPAVPAEEEVTLAGAVPTPPEPEVVAPAEPEAAPTPEKVDLMDKAIANFELARYRGLRALAENPTASGNLRDTVGERLAVRRRMGEAQQANSERSASIAATRGDIKRLKTVVSQLKKVKVPAGLTDSDAQEEFIRTMGGRISGLQEELAIKETALKASQESPVEDVKSLEQRLGMLDKRRSLIRQEIGLKDEEGEAFNDYRSRLEAVRDYLEYKEKKEAELAAAESRIRAYEGVIAAGDRADAAEAGKKIKSIRSGMEARRRNLVRRMPAELAQGQPETIKGGVETDFWAAVTDIQDAAGVSRAELDQIVGTTEAAPAPEAAPEGLAEAVTRTEDKITEGETAARAGEADRAEAAYQEAERTLRDDVAPNETALAEDQRRRLALAMANPNAMWDRKPFLSIFLLNFSKALLESVGANKIFSNAELVAAIGTERLITRAFGEATAQNSQVREPRPLAYVRGALEKIRGQQAGTAAREANQ